MTDFKARLDEARQCWNRGDLAGYLSVYDDSIKLHGYSPEPMNKAAVTGFYQQVFSALGDDGRPNPTLVFHEFMLEGELYCCRFTLSGVHRGSFLGVPATGKRYVLNGITMMRHADNRVVERWSSADMLGLLIQIGAVPPPPG